MKKRERSSKAWKLEWTNLQVNNKDLLDSITPENRLKVIAALLDNNSKFIDKISNFYSLKYPSWKEDIRQECVYGFIMAIDRFDTTKNFSLLTYAMFYMRKYALKLTSSLANKTLELTESTTESEMDYINTYNLECEIAINSNIKHKLLKEIFLESLHTNNSIYNIADARGVRDIFNKLIKKYKLNA